MKTADQPSGSKHDTKIQELDNSAKVASFNVSPSSGGRMRKPVILIIALVVLVVVVIGIVIGTRPTKIPTPPASTISTQSTNLKPLTPTAQDTIRKTSINSLKAHIDLYFAQFHKYPTLAELNSPGWRNKNLPSFENTSATDPIGNSQVIVATPTKNSYSYAPTGTNGQVCDDINILCTKYTVTATLYDGTTYSKSNL